MEFVKTLMLGSARRTARGPLRAILFFSMFTMASSGIAVLPSFRMGVTSTGSQAMGVCTALVSLQAQVQLEALPTNLGRSKDVLDRLGDLRADTVALDQADEEVALWSSLVYSSMVLTCN